MFKRIYTVFIIEIKICIEAWLHIILCWLFLEDIKSILSYNLNTNYLSDPKPSFLKCKLKDFNHCHCNEKRWVWSILKIHKTFRNIYSWFMQGYLKVSTVTLGTSLCWRPWRQPCMNSSLSISPLQSISSWLNSSLAFFDASFYDENWDYLGMAAITRAPESVPHSGKCCSAPCSSLPTLSSPSHPHHKIWNIRIE